MTNTLMIGLVVVIAGVLIGAFALPALAHGPQDKEIEQAEMYYNGDWETMHETYSGEMPCHDSDYHHEYQHEHEATDDGWHSRGGHMMGHW